MPGTMQYIDPSNSHRNDFIAAGRSERDQRKNLYMAVRNYYDGIQKKHLKKKENEPDDNVIYNLIKTSIDRTVAHLFTQMPRLELDPSISEETKDEKWLREAWEDNGGILFLTASAMNGSFSGHNYVRVLDKNDDHPFGRIINLDPTQMITYWRSDDMDQVVWYEQKWTDGDNSYILDFVNQQDHWDIIEYVNEGGSGWRLTDTTRWNNHMSPIVAWQHLPNPNRYYGYSEVNSLSVQDTVNLLYSEMARIVRYHASPKTVAIGVSAVDIKETAIDEMWAIESDNASITNLEMRSELQASQALAQELNEHFLAEARVVLLRGEVKDFQRVTNTGVRTVFLDMTAKNNILTAAYRQAIRKISQRLSLIGLGRELKPSVVFVDPLPTDRKELVDTLAIERSGNLVSRETASTTLGHHWPTELQKIKDEANDPVFAAAQAVKQSDPTLTGAKPAV